MTTRDLGRVEDLVHAHALERTDRQRRGAVLTHHEVDVGDTMSPARASVPECAEKIFSAMVLPGMRCAPIVVGLKPIGSSAGQRFASVRPLRPHPANPGEHSSPAGPRKLWRRGLGDTRSIDSTTQRRADRRMKMDGQLARRRRFGKEDYGRPAYGRLHPRTEDLRARGPQLSIRAWRSTTSARCTH